MEQVYMTLLIELTKAFLSIENAPNAHPRLKKALADALKPPQPIALGATGATGGTGSSH